MIDIFNIGVGLIIIFLLGLGVGPLIDCAKKSIRLEPPNKSLAESWKKLVKGNEGGKLLGNLERVIYFGAFWIGKPVIIGSWLAFKVATKWNAWSNIISVPKHIENVDPLDYLNARRRWGSQLLMTFLIGTAANIIISFVGVLLGKNAHNYLLALLN
jgi:hypothetical protein